jgi:hypothetical protein
MTKRKRKLSLADMAAVNFEPYSVEVLKRLESTSNETWLAHMASIRFAWIVLSKTKDELQKLVREIDDEGINPIEGFKNSADFLSAGVEFLTAAKARILCAGAAVAIEEKNRKSRGGSPPCEEART